MVENRPKSRIQHGERSDRSILMGQKSVEKAQIEKFKGDILGDFQTLCPRLISYSNQKTEENQEKKKEVIGWKRREKE